MYHTLLPSYQIGNNKFYNSIVSIVRPFRFPIGSFCQYAHTLQPGYVSVFSLTSSGE